MLAFLELNPGCYWCLLYDIDVDNSSGSKEEVQDDLTPPLELCICTKWVQLIVMYTMIISHRTATCFSLNTGIVCSALHLPLQVESCYC